MAATYYSVLSGNFTSYADCRCGCLTAAAISTGQCWVLCCCPVQKLMHDGNPALEDLPLPHQSAILAGNVNYTMLLQYTVDIHTSSMEQQALQQMGRTRDLKPAIRHFIVSTPAARIHTPFLRSPDLFRFCTAGTHC